MRNILILQQDAKALRYKAHPVLPSDIKSKKVRKIIADMKNAMYAEEDGIAIAAPQIGVSLQIFIVSGKFFYLPIKDAATKNTTRDVVSEKEFRKKDMVFFNPVITKSSRKKIWETEGCLSVRWKYGKTHRAAQVTISAYDENSELVTRGASGLLAQIFQHEIDHLNGILFTDHAKDVVENES